MIFIKLFISFFKIGLFSIGGGYVAIPLIQNEVVETQHWLTLVEFTDLITISEMTPGPIAINSATFVGTHIAGIWGSVAATLGFITPSIIILSIVAKIYFNNKDDKYIQRFLAGIRPVVVTMIATAGISVLELSLFGEKFKLGNFSSLNIKSLIIFLVSLFVLKKFKLHPIVLIACGIGAGIILYFLGV